MPKAYIVVCYREVRDPAALAKYANIAGPVIAAMGGRPIARGGQVISLEGGIDERTNILEFDSVEAAQSFYNCDDYQAALAVLGDAVDRDMRITEALE